MIEFIDLKAQQARIKVQLDAAIARVLQHGQYILGPEVVELEEKLAAYTGAKHCITVANGTDALQIAQMALSIGPGDEVITPTLPPQKPWRCWAPNRYMWTLTRAPTT